MKINMCIYPLWTRLFSTPKLKLSHRIHGISWNIYMIYALGVAPSPIAVTKKTMHCDSGIPTISHLRKIIDSKVPFKRGWYVRIPRRLYSYTYLDPIKMNLSPDNWPPKKMLKNPSNQPSPGWRCLGDLFLSRLLGRKETTTTTTTTTTGKLPEKHHQTPEKMTKLLLKTFNFPISKIKSRKKCKKITSFQGKNLQHPKVFFVQGLKTPTIHKHLPGIATIFSIFLPVFVGLSTSWAISLIFSKGFCGAWPLFMYLSRDARMAEPPWVSRLQKHV